MRNSTRMDKRNYKKEKQYKQNKKINIKQTLFFLNKNVTNKRNENELITNISLAGGIKNINIIKQKAL